MARAPTSNITALRGKSGANKPKADQQQDGTSLPEAKIDSRTIIAFTAMVFGMFMAILDIQIVSASLKEIQAGLAAGPDEISWVQTSYLIAEVIMIPLSGFLNRLLSTRVLFTLAAAGFTIASALCSTASSIETMIIWRALQGFIGGAMIPSVFAVAFTVFPANKRHIISPLIGLVATMAPTIGPTIGGYLSNAFSWHFLFLVNIPPGIIVTLIAWNFIDFDKANPALLRRFDWLGLIAMAAFLGSMEYVLEEGPRYDWLQDNLIYTFFIIMLIGGFFFFSRVLTAAEPVVDLRPFANINFALGSLFSFALGIGLYGLTYLYPLYLARIRDYDALMIGKTMFVSGLAMFMAAPLAGFLSSRMDLRLLMAIGLILFTYSAWLVTGLTGDWDFWELFWPQILRGVSIMLCMVPINNISLGTLPHEQLKNASGLFNLTRNLGGAVGLAVLNTILIRRGDFHYERLAEAVSWGRNESEDFIARLTQQFNIIGLDGAKAALAQIYNLVQQQANIMAFADAFYILTLLFGFLFFLVGFVKKV
ncbi:DHA2 family efflux MFS transporter permease subunit [Candidatus Tokpelaia sp.]|uniref:DHA2 family efflux MFS transporter permease subunit n=1 Tax=Candidatus Tokpelaia sp. TaxID=2233777 RepID=UPI00123ABA33|nr:DHA2 family efflux MFS transporter permease subunit [Candidatus Tokpelaia sp.]KAA6404548.1 MFS transporter [Candidatus Tokpelaia sp.]